MRARVKIYAFILLSIGVATSLKSQETTSKNRLNVLKTNILSPLSIGYERGIGQHFSLGAYGLYFPSFSFGQPNDVLGHVSLADLSSGFTVEARYYTSKQKAPLNGLYLGGYYLFRIADVFVHKTVTSSNNRSDVKAYIPSDLTSYGLMIGKQKMRTKGFTTDVNFGIGYYSVGNIPTITDDNNESFKIFNQLSKLRSGIGPRVNLCLGYAF
ncbi:MAG: DUF3575 domain-containing protein [Saprospiraceae bacterium]|nr:DUF3575 domain-containing protein [Saprospiraceae bacterium]